MLSRASDWMRNFTKTFVILPQGSWPKRRPLFMLLMCSVVPIYSSGETASPKGGGAPSTFGLVLSMQHPYQQHPVSMLKSCIQGVHDASRSAAYVNPVQYEHQLVRSAEADHLVLLTRVNAVDVVTSACTVCAQLFSHDWPMLMALDDHLTRSELSRFVQSTVRAQSIP